MTDIARTIARKVSFLPPKKRCWYCGRQGRYGWTKRRPACCSPQCVNDKACFRRRRYREHVRELRKRTHCPDCGNASTPGIVLVGGDALSGPLGDPCDSDFHPQNGYVL